MLYSPGEVSLKINTHLNVTVPRARLWLGQAACTACAACIKARGAAVLKGVKAPECRPGRQWSNYILVKEGGKRELNGARQWGCPEETAAPSLGGVGC